MKNPVILNEFTYGYPQILKKYCNALVKSLIYKDFYTSNKLCMEVLNIKSLNDIKYFSPSLYNENRYYSTILLLGVNLHNLNKYTIHKQLLQNTLSTLEDHIYNDEISISLSSYFFKKYYVNLLNNYADALYTLKEYQTALDICIKAEDFSIKYSTLYMLHFVLKLKVETLYKLDNTDLANITFSNFKSLCYITKNLEYMESSIIDFKNKKIDLNY